MDKQDALVTVFARNSFYKGLHYLALGALLLSLIVVCFLAWVLVYIAKYQVHPLYFLTDNTGRLLETVPVDKPNMSNQEVVAWAIEAAQAAYSYDYINYRAQLQSAEKYFTAYGWSKYMAALQASNNLTALTERKMIVLARVVYAPKLVTEGILSGAYAWKYEMSMLVTYMLPPYDEKSQFSNPLNISMIVQRQPEIKSYRGLGIVQIIGNIASAVPSGPRALPATPTG